MNEETFFRYLLGDNGGIFALGVIFGGILMWGANLKIINPYVEAAHKAQIDQVQAVQKAEIASLEIRFQSVLQRIKQLEEFEKLYWDIMKEHASASLHPNRTKEP